VAGKAVAVATWRCHLLAALDKSLDCWCFNIASDPDFDLGVLTWNDCRQGATWGNTLSMSVQTVETLLTQHK
jgi:hypothetical protein